MAQAVYSVNIVGYVNLTLGPGYSLVANQLNASPNNGLDAVFPSVPLESQVQKFVNNNFTVDIYDGTSWLDGGTGDPSTTTVSPGEGFFFFNPTATAITSTLVGEVITGNGITVPLPAGYSLVSSKVPQDISLTAANGFPQVLEMQYQSFTGTGFNVLINDGAGWLDAATGDPADARPTVGQGFFIFNPDATAHNWVRDFNPNSP
jgi:hypothetical protein